MKKYLLIFLMVVFPFVAYAAEPADSVLIVRYMINETTASFWSDAEIQEWLDQGVSDITSRTLCFQISDTITLATGTYEYATTTGSVAVSAIVKILGAFYISPDNEYIGLKRIEAAQIADLPFMIPGPPKYFCHYANKIIILPVPTTAENAQLVRIYFARQASGASLALRIADLPTECKPLLYLFAAAMAWKKEHRLVESDTVYKMYLEKITALKQEVYNTPPEILTK